MVSSKLGSACSWYFGKPYSSSPHLKVAWKKTGTKLSLIQCPRVQVQPTSHATEWSPTQPAEDVVASFVDVGGVATEEGAYSIDSGKSSSPSLPLSMLFPALRSPEVGTFPSQTFLKTSLLQKWPWPVRRPCRTSLAALRAQIAKLATLQEQQSPSVGHFESSTSVSIAQPPPSHSPHSTPPEHACSWSD